LRQRQAEAKARFNAGQRLARQRDAFWARSSGAFQVAGQAGGCDMTRVLTRWQTYLLQQYDTGVLQQELNNAIAEYGHGRLCSEAGDCFDIGGSTGGVSRRLIDDWLEPDCRDFLDKSETIVQFLRLGSRAGPERGSGLHA